MKQILQSLKTGSIELVGAPAPACKAGHLLITTRRSLISTGTERMLVEFGQANLLAKARSQHNIALNSAELEPPRWNVIMEADRFYSYQPHRR